MLLSILNTTVEIQCFKETVAITDCAKSGSGLAPDKNPQLYSIQKHRPRSASETR